MDGCRRRLVKTKGPTTTEGPTVGGSRSLVGSGRYGTLRGLIGCSLLAQRVLDELGRGPSPLRVEGHGAVRRGRSQ